MEKIRVRNVDEDKRRSRRELLDRLKRLHASILAHGGPLPDSTAIIREERDRRG